MVFLLLISESLVELSTSLQAEIKPTIAITLYRRPKYTRQMFEALYQCYGVKEIPISISCDYNEEYSADCNYVFDMAMEFAAGMPNCMVRVSQNNPRYGIDLNKLNVVPRAFSRGNYVILLEDDTIPAKDALQWFTAMGELYKDDQRVIAVGGYARVTEPELQNVYGSGYKWDHKLRRGFNPWGWAMWEDRWAGFYGQDGSRYKQDTGVQANGLFDHWLHEKHMYYVAPYVARVQSVGGERGEHTPSPEWHRENEFNEWGIWNFDISEPPPLVYYTRTPLEVEP
jgi:hypothetical protein